MNQVADIELIARTALALVFISSSIGKFIGRTGRMDLALAVVEAVFGLAIAVGIDRQLTAPVGRRNSRLSCILCHSSSCS